MKYQVIKHNKTGSRQLVLCDTLADAKAYVLKHGWHFDGLSYMGGFPTFRKGAGNYPHYSIQGSVEMSAGRAIVCSITPRELAEHGMS